MKTISKKTQQKARQFIEASGRPLEAALYAWHFLDGPVEAIYEALAAFQNTDGGFGHGLESDIRLPGSSVIATTMGMQVLREVNAPTSHPLVQGAMRYLTDTYNPSMKAWEIIPSNIDEAPHAPWWQYDEDIASRWAGFLFNPRAEIVGYLYDYADLVTSGVAEALTLEIEQQLAALEDRVEMHDVLCCIKLAETASLPKSHRDILIALLKPHITRLIGHNAQEWQSYTLRPLQVAPKPGALFEDVVADWIPANLDYLIDTQQEDGAWPLTWTWGDLYPEAWPQAKAEWGGVLTLQALQALHAYGRMEQ